MDRKAGLSSDNEALDADARRAHQTELLRKTVEICWESSDFYRGKLEQAGLKPDDIRDIDDLALIPVTTKKEAMTARAGLGTFPLHEAKRIFVSPGPHFYAAQRRDDPPPVRGQTPLAYAFHAMGFRENDIVLNTFSYHLTPGGFGLEDQLIAMGCAVVPAGPQNTEVQVEVLAKLPVTGYVGTPTFLKLLCDKAVETGVDPAKDWSLEVAFVTAEKLPEQLRAELQERTGAMVRQIYGSADGLYPAYECWAASGMHLHPDQVIEVLDPETRAPVSAGEPGEVVATVPNPNRPLLRFANADLVVLRDDPCPCGRTGSRIARVAGRVDESTKVRGMFVYPDQIAEVMARHPEVQRWQAVVEKNAQGTDDFRVAVELASEAAGLLDKITQELRDHVRLRADVDAVAPGAIAEGAKRLDDRRSYE
ncbi:MAG: phenylacetate--CoA ligase [Actinobacteria bacterium]|nr:MAG: phenylacetate--CoA ligase [Actinomycetota bacterium]